MSEAAAALPEPVFTTYAEFGRRFFQTAVTRERIQAATAGLEGRAVEFGPSSIGPIALIKVRADGVVGPPSVTPVDGEHVAFDVVVPVDLKLVIEIGPDRNRFAAQVKAHIGVTARPAEPLSIVIDLAAPSRRDVEVVVKAEGLRASVVQTLGRVDDEIRRAVAKVVRRELETPKLQQLRVIDVAKALDSLTLPG